MEKLHHIIEAQQFDRVWLEQEFFPLVREMEKTAAEGGASLIPGKKMITFFYEPSTRTRASFEIAMDMIGGKVVFSTENAGQFSSAVKGESIEDTMRVLSSYRPDVIVLRANEAGMAKRAAAFSPVPIINAGDGTGQHPTQSLTDVFTIWKRLGRIDNLTVALVGDLARGRTVHSLSYLLGKFSGIKIYFVSPESSKAPDDIKNYLQRHKIWFAEAPDLRLIAPEADVIYQTRNQKERGGPSEQQDSARAFYIVNKEILGLMKKDAIIMHPLPRNEEISIEVDKDPRAAYFKQAENGLYVRMALLKMILA
ncbi:MAG: aspartate carbamoyltransferase [bacterium]|nr:aspartate carbamoyltransferase [bacterium]